MNKAEQTIIEIIKNKVNVMNFYRNYEDMKAETLERFNNELTGMLVCLKNIKETDRFYCINYWENAYEFGYYDQDAKWFSITNNK